jgi:hypothetical protein
MAYRLHSPHQRRKTATGLSRGRYKGLVGMHRWVGFGVIADNLINIGCAMEEQADP